MLLVTSCWKQNNDMAMKLLSTLRIFDYYVLCPFLHHILLSSPFRLTNSFILGRSDHPYVLSPAVFKRQLSHVPHTTGINTLYTDTAGDKYNRQVDMFRGAIRSMGRNLKHDSLPNQSTRQSP